MAKNKLSKNIPMPILILICAMQLFAFALFNISIPPRFKLLLLLLKKYAYNIAGVLSKSK